MDANRIVEKFKSLFGGMPTLFRSPGRVNLIGEHTDYNLGYVMPAAIDKEIIFAVAPNGTDTCHIYSYDLDESGSFTLPVAAKSGQNWLNYLLGVTALLQQGGANIKGFDCVFGGNVPIGAGLSSSAAIENGMALALNHIFSLGKGPIDLVKVSQRAEHEYAGVKCGIMDQYASMCGRPDHAILLDCRSLETEYLPLNLKGYKLLLCDTGVSHSLASSEYNTRRQECERAVAVLKQEFPEVESLRDADLEKLGAVQSQLSETVYRRAKYVLEENARVLQAAEHLHKGALGRFGELMYGSHLGLTNDYEVSCPELDFLVDFTKDKPNVLGARMMGGGFGGCTINLVAENGLSAFVEEISAAYFEYRNIQLKTYITTVVGGTEVLK